MKGHTAPCAGINDSLNNTIFRTGIDDNPDDAIQNSRYDKGDQCGFHHRFDIIEDISMR